jgi:hypothetical protein
MRIARVIIGFLPASVGFPGDRAETGRGIRCLASGERSLRSARAQYSPELPEGP